MHNNQTGKNTGKNKVLSGVFVWIQMQLDNWTRTRGQNGSKKAKYEKISCLEEPDVFSRGWGLRLEMRRHHGSVDDQRTIKIHQKLIFFINKLLRFFLKKLWAWI